VREKGSSKKAGLIEAYADRQKMGFDWNNMMLQRYGINHNGDGFVFVMHMNAIGY
jgi:hypothetical protein